MFTTYECVYRLLFMLHVSQFVDSVHGAEATVLQQRLDQDVSLYGWTPRGDPRKDGRYPHFTLWRAGKQQYELYDARGVVSKKD